jgi:hypothetical protein
VQAVLDEIESVVERARKAGMAADSTAHVPTAAGRMS